MKARLLAAVKVQLRSQQIGKLSQLDGTRTSIVSGLWVLNVRLLQRHSAPHLETARSGAIWGLIVRRKTLCSPGKVRGKRYEE